MQTNEWLSSVNLTASRNVKLTQSCERKTLQRTVLWYCVGMLLLLVLLLTGCATTSTPPCALQPPVLMPATDTPLPSVTYSLQAQQDIESWRRRVMDMFRTSEPL